MSGLKIETEPYFSSLLLSDLQTHVQLHVSVSALDKTAAAGNEASEEMLRVMGKSTKKLS